MYNLKINFHRVIQGNLILDLRKQPFLNLLNAAAKPFKQMHSEFMLLVPKYRRKIRLTGQVQDIEQALNERYDATLKRIFISNYNSVPLYIYQEAELEPALYVYNEWNSAINYVTGEYSQVGFVVYKAKANNINKPPAANPAQWDVEPQEGSVLNQDSNFLSTFSFVVNVPVSIAFDADELSSIVRSIKMAGRSFTIVTF